mmetsp:Transcript_71319/g.154927  ORF Transcript_71319/g.154927 Transcript_71319/m.154927 type:complete len:202 (+) Transcript_71319:58-663(+)|eukprot:CAMPEP_0170569642 /NCGR_PEP_ID=MMETSP0224-20130122/669_1 /TAXON_ID=285029 /ORGANISM="Togula jolla, Strain CCCM 725" /LENGTH=201 /DNA_ID=CAMNT_0010891833 /DNA_START=38 /DNA_END=643 /DNA_ORIENTATION=+
MAPPPMTGAYVARKTAVQGGRPQPGYSQLHAPTAQPRQAYPVQVRSREEVIVRNSYARSPPPSMRRRSTGPYPGAESPKQQQMRVGGQVQSRLNGSAALEAVKTFQAVNTAVRAAHAALGVAKPHVPVGVVHPEAIRFSRDSRGAVDELSKTMPASIDRVSSLAMARMHHKENVHALDRSVRFTHGLLEKLGELRETSEPS